MILLSLSSDFICEVIWMPRHFLHLFRLGRLEREKSVDQAALRKPHYCAVFGSGQQKVCESMGSVDTLGRKMPFSGLWDGICKSIWECH